MDKGKLWYANTMEYYSTIRRHAFESGQMRWMNLEPIMQSEVSQIEKDKYHILMNTYGISKDSTDDSTCRPAKEIQTLWT